MSAPTPGPGDDRPREGYYPDPSIPGYVRYWNGAAWVPGTSRPAPTDGEQLTPPPGVTPAPAPVEETGPVFFDEEPLSAQSEDAQHGTRPEPASAWHADRSQQSGFGGDQDRRVSWGAPQGADPRAALTEGDADARRAESAEGTAAPSDGTVTFRRPTGGNPVTDGTMTIRAVPPRGAEPPQGSPQPPHQAGAQGPQPLALPGAQASPLSGPQHAGAPGAQQAGTPGAQQGPVSGPQRSTPSGPQHAGGQGPQQIGASAAQQGGASGSQPGALPGPQHATPSGPQQIGASAGQQASLPGPPQTGGPGSQQTGGPGPRHPGVPEVQQTGGPASQQAGASAAHPSAPASPHQSAALSAPPQSTPSVPQQSAPAQSGVPAGSSSTPLTTGPGGGQPSWAQEVHRLAQSAQGDGESPVAPWKPPANDPFLAAAQAQASARPAALGKRFVARLIDTVALGAVTAAAAVPLTVRAVDHINAKIDEAKLSGRTVTVWLLDGTTAGYLGVVLAVLLLFGVVYEALPTAKWGRTLGKKLCGLEVRDIEAHEPPAFGAAVRRWLVYSVPGVLVIGVVGVLWCLFDRPWRQCWHDKVAGTFVAG